MTYATRKPKVTLYVPQGLLPEGRHGQSDISHMDMDDPMPDPNRPAGGQKIKAAVNNRRDVLLFEYCNHRISDAAYLQGRILQQALVLRGGSGQSQWMEGDKVDAGSLVALAIARNIDVAKLANETIQHCRNTLGKHQGSHVVLCLRQPMQWQEVCARYGEAGPKAEAFYARLFRDGLEALADEAS